MNIPLVIEALEDAKANDIPFARGYFRNESKDGEVCYCTVGVLALYAGIKKEFIRPYRLSKFTLGIDSEESQLQKLREFYECKGAFPLDSLVRLNDNFCNKWDDVIEGIRSDKELANA